MNCTALYTGDALEIWAPSQANSIARDIAAKLSGLDKDQVTLHTTFMGGGFGRRAEMDFIEQAVSVAMQVPNRPVKLFWSREQDVRHDAFRPAAMCRIRGNLDSNGMPGRSTTSWSHSRSWPAMKHAHPRHAVARQKATRRWLRPSTRPSIRCRTCVLVSFLSSCTYRQAFGAASRTPGQLSSSRASLTNWPQRRRSSHWSFVAGHWQQAPDICMY